MLLCLVWLFIPTPVQAEQPVLLAAEPVKVELPQPIVQPVPLKPIIIKPSGYHLRCNCQRWASYVTGKSLGGARAAKYVVVNSHTPQVGAIVIFTSGWAGHAAIVTAIEGDYIVLHEANNQRCRITSGRRVNMNRTDIKGYVI